VYWDYEQSAAAAAAADYDEDDDDDDNDDERQHAVTKLTFQCKDSLRPRTIWTFLHHVICCHATSRYVGQANVVRTMA